MTIRVEMPFHLRTLSKTDGEVSVEVNGSPTLGATLEALEAKYPVLRGAIRDHVTKQRRPFVRFYACQQDLSNEPPDTELPQPVQKGAEPLMIVGAIAGG